MRTRIQIWVCDRCNKRVEVTTPADQPIGWGATSLFCPPESAEPNENYGNGPTGRKHLCGGCRAEYRQWFLAGSPEAPATAVAS